MINYNSSSIFVLRAIIISSAITSDQASIDVQTTCFGGLYTCLVDIDFVGITSTCFSIYLPLCIRYNLLFFFFFLYEISLRGTTLVVYIPKHLFVAQASHSFCISKCNHVQIIVNNNQSWR